MYDFERYYQAQDVPDAVRALAADENALVIAGGSDVLIKLRSGRLTGASLVSIHGIRALQGVEMAPDGTIVIGPAASFAHITAHPLIRQYLPVLGEAVDQAGGPQLRKVGTIGGNVCNGATSADSAATLLVLDAVLELTSALGVRQIPLREFYTGPGRTVRRREELLTAIRIPKSGYEGFFGQYLKYGKRNAMEIATLGCAALVKLTPDKTHVAQLRLGYGVAAPTPIRCPGAEAAAGGLPLDDALLETVAQCALKEISPRSSWRAEKEFRQQLAAELARRAVRSAAMRAGGVWNA
jgi:xanthine dehydrogenase FAD-binding subunit